MFDVWCYLCYWSLMFASGQESEAFASLDVFHSPSPFPPRCTHHLPFISLLHLHLHYRRQGAPGREPPGGPIMPQRATTGRLHRARQKGRTQCLGAVWQFCLSAMSHNYMCKVRSSGSAVNVLRDGFLPQLRLSSQNFWDGTCRVSVTSVSDFVFCKFLTNSSRDTKKRIKEKLNLTIHLWIVQNMY